MNLTYSDYFQACTDIVLTNDGDEFFHNLCADCALKLKDSYNFIQKAKQSDEIIRGLFKNTGQSEHLLEYVKDIHYEIIDAEHLECREEIELDNEDAIIEVENTHKIEEKYNYKSDASSKCDELFDIRNEVNKHIEIVPLNVFGSKETPSERQLEETDKTTISEHLLVCSAKEMHNGTNGTSLQNKKNKIDECMICNEEIPYNISKFQHEHKQHANFVKCTQCEHICREFKMPIHVHNTHDQSERYMCKICSKSYISKSILKAHLNYHDRKRTKAKSDPCDVCGKQFATQYYLRQHKKMHGDERQVYECKQCEKQYQSKIALDNHMKMHSGDTIKCTVCEKPFSRQYELNVHMRFHTRNFPYECDLCDRKFAIKGHLRSHMWRHQGLKLQCDQCSKLFTSSKALNEHSYLHTPAAMPFTCSYCLKSYPSRQKYKVHLKAAHLKELDMKELKKATANQTPKPLVRKHHILVQASNFITEEEVTCDTEDIEVNPVRILNLNNDNSLRYVEN
ncbi:zinc finger protein 658B-like isoform X2 [Teleopsis dalmanni]|nr:zinc finger protein 658B-like isoform X2 [Teleopsis dalmanni]